MAVLVILLLISACFFVEAFPWIDDGGIDVVNVEILGQTIEIHFTENDINTICSLWSELENLWEDTKVALAKLAILGSHSGITTDDYNVPSKFNALQKILDDGTKIFTLIERRFLVLLDQVEAKHGKIPTRPPPRSTQTKTTTTTSPTPTTSSPKRPHTHVRSTRKIM